MDLLDLFTQVNCLICPYPKQIAINLNLISAIATDGTKVSVKLFNESNEYAVGNYSNELAALEQLRANGNGQVYGVPTLLHNGKYHDKLVLVMSNVDFSLTWLIQNGIEISEENCMQMLYDLVCIIYYDTIQSNN